MRATSPRVIMPTPILRESQERNRQHRAASPQPITLLSSATATKASENSRILRSRADRSVLSPMLAKNTGPKIR